jgi:hypothetical protein
VLEKCCPLPVKVIGGDEYGAAGTAADSTAQASANGASAPNGYSNGASSSGTGNGYGNSNGASSSNGNGGNSYDNGASSGTGGEYGKKGKKYGKVAEVEAIGEKVVFEPLVCKVRRCVQEGGVGVLMLVGLGRKGRGCNTDGR